jgi:hypothetical protein
MADDDLPPAADALYGLPLERFTVERNALAKQLRGEGDRDAAKRVTALRKPSVAAWTINQLVRSRSKDVGLFAQAADALRDAQAALIEGRGSPADLRDARAAERAAAERLVELARGLFPAGREAGQATLERVAATLHAATADEAARSAVLSGRLLTEREPSGFGDLRVELPDAPPARATEAEPEEEDGQAADAEAEARLRAEAEAREAAERERRARIATLKAALEDAVAERVRAEASLEAARAEEARLRSALEKME